MLTNTREALHESERELFFTLIIQNGEVHFKKKARSCSSSNDLQKKMISLFFIVLSMLQKQKRIRTLTVNGKKKRNDSSRTNIYADVQMN